jgi:hypothetical protein
LLASERNAGDAPRLARDEGERRGPTPYGDDRARPAWPRKPVPGVVDQEGIVTQNTADLSGTQIEDREEPRPQAATGAVRRRRGGRPWILLLALLVTAFLVDVLRPYLTLDPGRSRIVLRPDVPVHYPIAIAHILFGTIALSGTVLQLWPWLRRRHRAVHRWVGRVYVYGGALPCSLMALALMPLTHGWSGNIGITTQAVLWFGTTVAGYRMARQGRYADHRRWMIYSAALALGVLWGRATVDVYTITHATFSVMFVFEIARWLGWMVNLAVAQWWIEHTAGRRLPETVG